jgi:hypothetical protein
MKQIYFIWSCQVEGGLGTWQISCVAMEVFIIKQ